MKKFGKFLITTLSVAACIGGAYYFVKNILNKNTKDDFDSFDDDFEDFEGEDDKEDSTGDDREYVTLNFQEDEEIDFDSPTEAAPEEPKEESSAADKKDEE